MTKRALVTGAAGFIGYHLVHHLHGEGIVVHGLDRPGVPMPADQHIDWHTCDVTNAAQVEVVVSQIQPDYVFHLAALLKSESCADLLAVNVVGTQNVLDALVATRPEARVLVTGSSAEYGLVQPDELPIREENSLRPLSPYGVSKVAQSLLAAQYTYRHDLAVIRTRTFNLTGPGEPDTLVCSAFAKQIAEIERGLRPPVLKVGNLESTRDFLDVRDAVRAYWLSCSQGTPGEVYNVCSGQSVKIEKILQILTGYSTSRIQIEIDANLFSSQDISVSLGSAEKLCQATGWNPLIPLEESLRELLASHSIPV